MSDADGPGSGPTGDVSRETRARDVPADVAPDVAPGVAGVVFGTRLPLAQRYAELLAGPGTERGLLGPREVPRLWERHLINCALLSDLVEAGSTLCDLGSGAGLPGIAVAVRRSDLQVTLVEPLLRRVRFLDEVVQELQLDNVEVVRARAEQLAGSRHFDVVASRAVAPLPKLASWSLPLVRLGGLMLAMKGVTAAEEVRSSAQALKRAGGRDAQVVVLRVPVDLAERKTEEFLPTTVVRVESTRPAPLR